MSPTAPARAADASPRLAADPLPRALSARCRGARRV
jgi:hypothetical protein